MRDLDRAFALARLTSLQVALIQAAREASWSEAAMRGEEPKPFDLSATELSELLESDRSRVSKAKADLIKANILVKSDGGLVINKDYTTWKRTAKPEEGQPRFNPVQLAHITQLRRKDKKSERGASATPTVAPAPQATNVQRGASATGGVALAPQARGASATLFTGAVIGTPASEERERFKKDLHDEDPPAKIRDDDGGQKPLAQRPEFQARLRELNRWHQDSHPGDLAITHVHISLLLAKAPDHPEWVKDAIEDSLLRATGSKSTYAMSCLMGRVKDPEAWERERARRAGKTASGAKLLPSQTSPPPNLYIPTAEDRAIWAVQMERRRELGKLRAAERNRRMAK